MTVKSQKRLWWRCISFALFTLTCGGLQARELPRADRPANAAARSVHDEAVRILESIRTTKYQHKTEIDEDQGSYLCDCSGFVGYVLNRTVGKEGGGALGDGRKRPLAMDYEKFFAAAPASRNGNSGWQRITRLADARPGDVIAWRHEKPKPGNTGHVVIVGERPVLEVDGLVRVVTIDSSTLLLHDDKNAEGNTGVGRRVMWFTIDNDGRPVSYIRGSRTAELKTEAISIGRALRSAKKTTQRPTTPARAVTESN
jgi:hypothetical protein